MATATLYATSGRRVYSGLWDMAGNETETTDTLYFNETAGNTHVVMRWDTWPDAIKYTEITSVALALSGPYSSDDVVPSLLVKGIVPNDLDYSSVTYCTLNRYLYTLAAYKYAGYNSVGSVGVVLNALKYGLAVAGLGDTSYPIIYTYLASVSLRPRLIVTYNPSNRATPTISAMTPSAGSYAAKSAANTFSWSIGKSFDCLAVFSQTSATFQWRASSSGSTNSVAISGSTQSYTLPANTFTTNAPQWRVEVTCNDGSTVTSDWVTLNTAETTSEAVAVSPKGVVVDGSKAIVFQWRHVIATGTAQKGYDLQTSADGTTWTTRKSETTSTQSCTLAANTLAAGTCYWRVRTYNTDSAAGSWSEAAVITVAAAPAAPGVTVTAATPRAAFRWSGTDQQAYQYQIDDYDSGAIFGTANAVRSPVLLGNGQHVVRVRIQNAYGLWSNWGTAGFRVTNSSGAAITLTGTAAHTAQLSWTTSGSYGAYYIYRDGQPIAKTTGTSYVDNLLPGTASYYVIGVPSGSDNYTRSNTVSLTLTTDYKMIAPVDSWTWQALRLTTEAVAETRTVSSRQAASTYFAGQTYPTLELSEFYSKSTSFETAFADRSAAKAFEALLGQVVCLKTEYGDSVVGLLDTLDKAENGMYTAFAVKISQIDYPEVIDLD